VQIFKIDWILAAGTTYKTENDQVLVFRKVGTDSTSDVTIKVDGSKCGAVNSYIAPLRLTTSGSLGPFDLGDKFIVVPNGHEYLFDGSGNIRVVGELIKLGPGETVPADIIARYNDQFWSYYLPVSDSYSFGSATSWADGSEVEVYSLTPTTIEKYIFKHFLRMAQSGITYSTGDISVLFLMDDIPLYNQHSGAGEVGLDFDSFVVASDRLELFNVKDKPIEVLGDHTFKIKAKNVSGGALSISSASITFYAMALYEKRKG